MAQKITSLETSCEKQNLGSRHRKDKVKCLYIQKYTVITLSNECLNAKRHQAVTNLKWENEGS